MEFLTESNPVLMAGAVLVIFFGYILTRKKRNYDLEARLANQSFELKGNEPARLSALCKNGKIVSEYHEEVRTIYDAVLRGLRFSADQPLLGVRHPDGGPYKWTTHQQTYDRSWDFGSGLLKLWHQPGQSTFIGIFSGNRPEWIYTDVACNIYSFVSVPLYDTLGLEAVIHIINQVGLETIVVDTDARVNILKSIADKVPTLKNLVVIDEKSAAECEDDRFDIRSFKSVQDLGSAKRVEPTPPKPSDMYTLCYTSGTTGDPKGVIITHEYFLQFASGILKQLEGKADFNSSEVLISYLPLPHIFERANAIIVLMVGARMGFFRGDVRKLIDDIQELKPTYFPTVPRLLNRLYDQVTSAVRGSYIKSSLLKIAISQKKDMLKRGITTRSSIWDHLVFRSIQDKLGGRLRFVFTGSAPLSSQVLDLIRCSLGCWVLEGYGQTEHPIISITSPEEFDSGHVGPPVPCNKVKLVDVPELNYFAKNGEGEICAKATHRFPGYYKNPEKTAEAIDADGWIHTGDIGRWLPNGTLKIIDRKKQIFKLAQGEYIAPEKIENVYMGSRFVQQIFVDGDSLQTCIVAIIVPDPVTLSKWAKKRGLPTDMETLCANQDLKKEVMTDLQNLGKVAGLKSFEQVKNIVLKSELFTIKDGLLTATLKNKRPALRKFFQTDTSQLYKEL
ncbi:long-chain-fatty-acid--CoA ligase 5-like [Tubulanus polymorphus]|uniref:long-chain-fatty-acid--CoA ligase 5-like n=1 Tax=Tubulanus polymorphus TaxID=672921 RepID=UPI003DA634F6